MKPIPIPDSHLPEGFTKKTYDAPGKDVIPVEVMVPGKELTMDPRIFVLIEVTDDDITRLQMNGGKLWLTFQGTLLPPFNIGPL